MFWFCNRPNDFCLRLARQKFLGLIVLLSLAPACSLVAAGCFPAPSGLVGWWPGDGNANDIVSTNNGTLQGGASANAVGVVGLAFNFDGTNGYVQIPDAPALKPTNLTVEAWVRFTSLNSSVSGTAPAGEQFIVFKQNPSQYSFEGYYLGKTRIAGQDHFTFQVTSASAATCEVDSVTLVVTGVWYHVAAARGSNYVQLYVNGQLESTNSVSFAQDYGTLPLYFGTSGESYWDGKLAGTLDEVSLYNRALSSNEVAAIYAVGAAGKCKGASITVEPQSQTVVAGTNALLTVTATGFGTLSYQWQLNGTNIVGASSTNLALNDVQPTNAGSYTVVVTNSLASVTSAVAVLTVLAPPSITSPPGSRTNECTSTATFTVAAAGMAPLTYQWYFNGSVIANATGTSLAMTNVHSPQQGNYTVVVTNSVGSVTSAPAALTVVDTTPPVITLLGANPLTNECHAAFTDPGATASDTCAGSLAVTTNSTVNPNAVGVYTITYTATDPSGNWATNTRTVYVVDTTVPVITLNGANPLTNECHAAFGDPGATASDTCAGSLGVTTNSAVNPNAVGVYTIKYTATNPSGNSATNTRTVYVVDTTAPVITLNGANPLTNECYTAFTDPGATANDACAGNVAVTTNGTVNPNAVGVYTIKYTATDPSGNSATNTRTVYVVPPGCFPVPLGLVGWWPGDGNANDIANTNNGTLEGGAAASAVGVVGLAFSFDGTNGYVQIPDAPALKPTNLTVEAWVLFSSLNSAGAGGSPAGQQYLVFKQNSQSNSFEGFALTKWRGTSADVFEFQVTSASDQSAELTSVSTVTTGVWYHVAGVRGSNYLQLYVNGQLESQTNVSFAQNYGTLPLYFATSGETYWDHKFAGTLDEVSLYNRALAPNEVAAIYAAGAAGKCKGASITVQPQSQAVAAGTNALLTVTASGSGTLSYQWQFNGTDIAGATGSSLTFNSVQAANAGNYTVLVTNAAGSVTSAVATLTVWIPPAITVQPQSATAVGGSAAIFSVTATGIPPPSYQWQLNGVNLTNSFYFSGATSSTLEVDYVLWDPCYAGISGGYSVVVTNAAGSVTSATANLTVTVPSSVSFPDANLEAAVRLALSGPTGPLTFSNLQALTSLTACGQHITNLCGLEYAANLVSLYLPGNGISDLAPLQCLNKLVQLGLYHNHIRDLSPLAALISLTNLYAGDNLITDASVLSNLTGLTSLSLCGNAICNLAFVRTLNQLGALALDKNNITDPSPLANLTSLSSLALGGNPGLANYTVLSNLTNLTCLSLRESSLRDLGILGGLKRLTYLDLYNVPLSNLSPLTNLAALSRLDISWDYFVTNCAVLGGSTSLTNLYLRGIPIGNASFLANLYRLNFLNLDSTRITNASPLGGLTNLTYLSMTGNGAITNVSVLSNLTGLINLELRANSISNIAFMSSLIRLGYADLAYNSIGDISPLAGLTNLNSLVLAGNPTNNYSSLSNNSALTNLWLFDGSISDVSFVTNMPWLSYLNLERNNITNIDPLNALTNLTGLGLSQNPIANYTSLAAFTNLSSLRLENNSLTETNASFLSHLAQLTFLSLNYNRIADLSSLNGLPRINDLYLRRNRLSAIDTLESLPRLLNVDVSLNLLDLSSNSAPLNVIQRLLVSGVSVTNQPQNQPPTLHSSLNKWFISANINSLLTVFVSESPLPADNQLVVTAGSSNPNLVSIVANPLPSTNYSRTLTVAAGNPASQTATITLTVTDDVLLTGSTNILVTVVANTSLSNLCPNIDPNLAAAISVSAGKPVSDLTAADLLTLSQLSVQNLTTGDASVWQWLTNLTALYLSGSSISNLAFLTNLTQLASLTLNNASVTDFSPLDGLSNLIGLSLYGDFISDLSFLTNLTQLGSLSLYMTLVTDLSPLGGLTNLQSLYLQQNRIVNVVSLTNLSQLSLVDLSLNLLDLNPGSATMAAIQELANQGVMVTYLPQRQPPVIAMNTNWIIAANEPAWLYFTVSDNAPFGNFSVVASASNTNLIPGANLVVGQDVNDIDWFLNLTSASNEVGTTTITLTAMNDAGLSTNASILVTVDLPLPFDGPVFSDTNFTSWATGGDAQWFGQTNVSPADAFAAQSGSVTNNGYSSLEAAVNGPGLLTFWWKVSSQTNYGFLTFYVDTNEQALITGEVDWQEQVYELSPGLHTLWWSYWKSANTSWGMDAGWVAQVSFVPVSWLQAAGASVSGQFCFTLYGVPGSAYQILTSTNLVNWETQGTITIPATSTSGTVLYIDSLSTNFPMRFYRAQQQPQ
jgi:Leucine-rich repeat (LRR) protein